jgi:hypothetical protein
MKVLSVPQPYASLMAAGISDAFYNSWKPKEAPSRYLVYATKQEFSFDEFLKIEKIEWYQEIVNQIFFGNLPDFCDMPYGAIIGYVTIDKIEQLSDETGNYFKWHFKDAYLFDEPITGVKGRPRLWDYELDENNLPPAHKVVLNEVQLDGKDINIPISNFFWDIIKPDGLMMFENTDVFQDISCKIGEAPFVDMKYRINFFNNGHKRSFHLKVQTDVDQAWCVSRECDENGSPCIYNSVYSGEREYITFYWDYEIK